MSTTQCVARQAPRHTAPGAAAQAGGQPAAQPLPWFGTIDGYALVPPPGSLGAVDDPAAIIVLTEGGQLMVHDLKTGAPVPLSLPFQVGRGSDLLQDCRREGHTATGLLAAGGSQHPPTHAGQRSSAHSSTASDAR